MSARVEHVIDAAPGDVFDVLADPRSYAYWVIGSIKIRDAEPDWPAAGSRFHHTVGIGPLRLQDHTAVEDVVPGRFLQLKTRARPMGNARVKLELTPHDGGTRVTMIEGPADKPTALLFVPPTPMLLRRRNKRSLERLAELAEGRRPMPGEESDATVASLAEDGSVVNPEARRRHRQWMVPLVLAGVGVGALLIAARAKR
jgi:uncharacterized protein YndB with AHSA1/START domain